MIRVVREIVYEYTDDVWADQDIGMWELGGGSRPAERQFGIHKKAISRIVSRETT